MDDAEVPPASPPTPASERSARNTSRKRRVPFSQDENAEVKDRQGTGLKGAGEDITSLPDVLTNEGEDEDEHIDADIPVSVVGPTEVRGDAAHNMDQDTATHSSGHAKAQTHNVVCQWVAESRDAKATSV